jgi:hypothetical protein
MSKQLKNFSPDLSTSIALIVTFTMGTLSLIVPIITLIYIYRLEKPDCNCVRDWRHNFIKFWTILSIIIAVFLIATKFKNNLLMLAILVMQIVYTYGLFTYISDLNSQKCKCATESSPWINEFLRFWRYVMIFTVSFLSVSTLINLVKDIKK